MIYLGKNGTIKIDKKGRPKLFNFSTALDGIAEKTNYGGVTIRIEGDTNNHDIRNLNNNNNLDQGNCILLFYLGHQAMVFLFCVY